MSTWTNSTPSLLMMKLMQDSFMGDSYASVRIELHWAIEWFQRTVIYDGYAWYRSDGNYFIRQIRLLKFYRSLNFNNFGNYWMIFKKSCEIFLRTIKSYCRWAYFKWNIWYYRRASDMSMGRILCKFNFARKDVKTFWELNVKIDNWETSNASSSITFKGLHFQSFCAIKIPIDSYIRKISCNSLHEIGFET